MRGGLWEGLWRGPLGGLWEDPGEDSGEDPGVDHGEDSGEDSGEDPEVEIGIPFESELNLGLRDRAAPPPRPGREPTRRDPLWTLFGPLLNHY